MMNTKVMPGTATCTQKWCTCCMTLQGSRLAPPPTAHRQHAHSSSVFRQHRDANSHVACAAGSRRAGREPANSSDPLESKVKVVPLPQATDVMYEEGEFVEVGRVSGAFGVLGEVRIEISTDNPKARFGAGKKIFLNAPRLSGLLAAAADKQQGMLQLTTASAKVQVLPRGEEAWILKFQELTDRSQAEQLLGYTLLIPASAREPLRDPDQFWVQDLVGCRVFHKSNGKFVGKVQDVYSGTGTHDTLLIQLAVNKDDVLNSRSRQCMVPFAKALCPHVDVNQKQLVVDPPEGLLDMFTYKKLKRKLTPEQTAEKLELLDSTSPPVLDVDTLQEKPAAPPRPRRPSAWGSQKPGQKSSQKSDQKQAQAAAPSSQASNSASHSTSTSKSASPQQQKAATHADQGDALGSAAPQVHQEHESDEGSERVEDTDTSTASASALERWKLRRRLGVSFASKRRRAP